MNKELWSEKAKSITPYVPGEQPKEAGVIKLNTNENPYPPAPGVSAAVAETCARLRKYPDPDSTALRKAIADMHGVSPDMVFMGNGSDEVLAFAFLAFFDKSREILMPEITYSFYRVYAGPYSIPFRELAPETGFDIPVSALAQDCGGVVFANPNAPTSIARQLTDVERIAAACSRVVIVDEAYIVFGGETALPLLAKYPNILVVRTFSKSHSLAGARVGYAVGAPGLIAALQAIKNSFNSYTLSMMTQAAALAAVTDAEYCNARIAEIVSERKRTAERLRGMGFTMPEPSANFVFVEHASIPGLDLMRELRARNILVRRFDLPQISNHLRITIGTPAEMDALIAALREIIAAR